VIVKKSKKTKLSKRWLVLAAVLLLAFIFIASSMEIKQSQETIDQLNGISPLLKTSVANKLGANYSYAHSSYCSLSGTEGGAYFDDGQYCESNLKFTFPQTNPQVALTWAEQVINDTNSALPASSTKPLGQVQGIASDFGVSVSADKPTSEILYTYNPKVTCYFSLYYYNKGSIITNYGYDATQNTDQPPIIPPVTDDAVVFNSSCDANVSKPYLMDPFKSEKNSKVQSLPVIFRASDLQRR
jgi:hypothetical protein